MDGPFNLIAYCQRNQRGLGWGTIQLRFWAVPEAKHFHSKALLFVFAPSQIIGLSAGTESFVHFYDAINFLYLLTNFLTNLLTLYFHSFYDAINFLYLFR